MLSSNFDELELAMGDMDQGTCRAVMELLIQIGRHINEVEKPIIEITTQLTEITNTLRKLTRPLCA